MNQPWTNPHGLAAIETALANGTLYVPAGNDRWYAARRNGRTKLWSSRPGDFRLPIKYGFRNYGAITESTPPQYLRVAASRDAAEAAS